MIILSKIEAENVLVFLFNANVQSKLLRKSFALDSPRQLGSVWKLDCHATRQSSQRIEKVIAI